MFVPHLDSVVAFLSCTARLHQKEMQSVKHMDVNRSNQFKPNKSVFMNAQQE